MYCKNCGKQIDDKADVCMYCGKFTNSQITSSNVSVKNSGALIPLILMIVYTAVLFIPIVYNQTYWKANTPGVGIYSRGWTAGGGIFSVGLSFLSVVVLLLSILAVVVLVLAYLGNKSDLITKGLYSPIVVTVIFIVFSLIAFSRTIPNGEPGGTASAGYYGYLAFGPSFGFFIECILLIVSCVMCIKLSKELK